MQIDYKLFLQLRADKHVRLQSKGITAKAYETALVTAKELEQKTMITAISLSRVAGTDLFGTNGAELVGDEIFNNSFLTLHRSQGNEVVLEKISFLDIENATKNNGIGYPVFWDHVDFSKSRIFCGNYPAIDNAANEKKVFEFGVRYRKESANNQVG